MKNFVVVDIHIIEKLVYIYAFADISFLIIFQTTGCKIPEIMQQFLENLTNPKQKM